MESDSSFYAVSPVTMSPFQPYQSPNFMVILAFNGDPLANLAESFSVLYSHRQATRPQTVSTVLETCKSSLNWEQKSQETTSWSQLFRINTCCIYFPHTRTFKHLSLRNIASRSQPRLVNQPHLSHSSFHGVHLLVASTTATVHSTVIIKPFGLVSCTIFSIALKCSSNCCTLA